MKKDPQLEQIIIYCKRKNYTFKMFYQHCNRNNINLSLKELLNYLKQYHYENPFNLSEYTKLSNRPNWETVIKEAKTKDKEIYTLRKFRDFIKDKYGWEIPYSKLQKRIKKYIPNSNILKPRQKLKKVKRTNISKTIRYEVMKRAGFKCECCGAMPDKDNNVILTVDHIIPLTDGGTNTEDNLQCLCKRCNRGKSSFYTDNFRKIKEGERKNQCQ